MYNLIQQLMIDNHDIVDFHYEPFLWDKSIFNGNFQQVKSAFTSMNSISIEGIYHHQKLPLFIDNPQPFISNEYLTGLLHPQDFSADILLKFIRANGRIQLLNSICPDLKFIFIIRNPLDSVNSVMTRFSYYGGEFHHDDFPRFIEEINSRYHLNYSTENVQTQIERELLFWYYMNRFALETIALKSIHSVNICYENYLDDPGGNIKKICTFLNYRFKDDYLAKATEKVGDITNRNVISEAEFAHVLPYFEKYVNLLNENNIENQLDENNVFEKYVIEPGSSVRTRKYYGLTPVAIIKKLEAAEKSIDELTQKTEAQSRLISELKNIPA